MRISAIDAFLITLPFRFAFKHSLASRDRSENLIVRVVMEEGTKRVVGYGEGIPRDYVTGENPDGALMALRNQYAPLFLNRTFTDADQVISGLAEAWRQLKLNSLPQGASWCAFELAILDAATKLTGQAMGEFLAQQADSSRASAAPRAAIQYGAVIPFGGTKALTAALWFYRLYGFKTVKIKVGQDLDLDLYRLRQARSILGSTVKLRVDANCAWSVDQTISTAERMRPLGVQSYEQPLPADQLDGLAAVTEAIPEQVLADESLCTVNDARYLAENKICSAFNIRISKVGGILAARQIAAIAREFGIACHMGAQVGESGILSAAGRAFAATQPEFENYEGSNNLFLLKRDITRENLNVGFAGTGKLLKQPGLGVTVIQERLQEFIQSGTIQESPPIRHQSAV